MDEYQYIKKEAFNLTYNSLMAHFDENDLLNATLMMKECPYADFGRIMRLKQSEVAEFFPLVVDGSWKVKEAYYASSELFSFAEKKPHFVRVESYKEWQRLKKKYPKGFDYYEGGSKAWDDYIKNYPDFWGDARMFDGQAEFRFGKSCVAPRIVTSLFESTAHPNIQDDELLLIIYEDSHEFNNTNPGVCYVLTPNKDNPKARMIEIYNHFKSHIVSAYVRMLMRKHEEEEAKKLALKLIGSAWELQEDYKQKEVSD